MIKPRTFYYFEFEVHRKSNVLLHWFSTSPITPQLGNKTLIFTRNETLKNYSYVCLIIGQKAYVRQDEIKALITRLHETGHYREGNLDTLGRYGAKMPFNKG